MVPALQQGKARCPRISVRVYLNDPQSRFTSEFEKLYNPKKAGDSFFGHFTGTGAYQGELGEKKSKFLTHFFFEGWSHKMGRVSVSNTTPQQTLWLWYNIVTKKTGAKNNHPLVFGPGP